MGCLPGFMTGKEFNTEAEFGGTLGARQDHIVKSGQAGLYSKTVSTEKKGKKEFKTEKN